MAGSPQPNQKRTRLTISLPDSGRERLRRLKGLSGDASLGATVGKALAVYELVVGLVRDGHTIESVSPMGERRQLVVLP